jgi:hypothetical protein
MGGPLSILLGDQQALIVPASRFSPQLSDQLFGLTPDAVMQSRTWVMSFGEVPSW